MKAMAQKPELKRSPLPHPLELYRRREVKVILEIKGSKPNRITRRKPLTSDACRVAMRFFGLHFEGQSPAILKSSAGVDPTSSQRKR